jgi:TatD DNase family protein
MYEDFDEVISNAFENGVKKIIIPAVETKYFQKILDITQSNENIYAMMGVFPTEAPNWNDTILDEIREFSKSPKVVAIGEIGLDYYWDKTYVENQKEIFIKQIELANELKLPIEIHDREAHKDTFDIIKEYNKCSDVIFHCFSGSVEFSRECVKEGWYIAIGGVVTFKNAHKMKEVAKDVPIDRLMLETDSPYLTPVPYRGKENQPAYVRYVAEEISKIKGIDLDELSEITTKNAEKVFKI